MGPRVAILSLLSVLWASFIAFGMKVSKEYSYRIATTVWLYGLPVNNFASIGPFKSPLLSGLSFKYNENASFLCCMTSCRISSEGTFCHCSCVSMMFSFIRPSITSFFEGRRLPFFEWNQWFDNHVLLSAGSIWPSSSRRRN